MTSIISSPGVGEGRGTTEGERGVEEADGKDEGDCVERS